MVETFSISVKKCLMDRDSTHLYTKQKLLSGAEMQGRRSWGVGGGGCVKRPASTSLSRE